MEEAFIYNAFLSQTVNRKQVSSKSLPQEKGIEAMQQRLRHQPKKATSIPQCFVLRVLDMPSQEAHLR